MESEDKTSAALSSELTNEALEAAIKSQYEQNLMGDTAGSTYDNPLSGSFSSNIGPVLGNVSAVLSPEPTMKPPSTLSGMSTDLYENPDREQGMSRTNEFYRSTAPSDSGPYGLSEGMTKSGEAQTMYEQSEPRAVSDIGTQRADASSFSSSPSLVTSKASLFRGSPTEKGLGGYGSGVKPFLQRAARVDEESLVPKVEYGSPESEEEDNNELNELDGNNEPTEEEEEQEAKSPDALVLGETEVEPQESFQNKPEVLATMEKTSARNSSVGASADIGDISDIKELDLGTAQDKEIKKEVVIHDEEEDLGQKHDSSPELIEDILEPMPKSMGSAGTPVSLSDTIIDSSNVSHQDLKETESPKEPVQIPKVVSARIQDLGTSAPVTESAVSPKVEQVQSIAVGGGERVTVVSPFQERMEQDIPVLKAEEREDDEEEDKESDDDDDDDEEEEEEEEQEEEVKEPVKAKEEEIPRQKSGPSLPMTRKPSLTKPIPPESGSSAGPSVPVKPTGMAGLPLLTKKSSSGAAATGPRPPILGVGSLGLPTRPSGTAPPASKISLEKEAGAQTLPPTAHTPDIINVPPQATALAAAGNGGALDGPDEPQEIREARSKLMDIRLIMLRVAHRLDMRPMDIAVNEFMNKTDMTERVRYPMRTGVVRPQLDTLFNRAIEMDQESGIDSDLNVKVTVLVIGPVGSGKSSVIQNLLNPGHGLSRTFAPNPTPKVTTFSGDICGVKFTFIDTPGLCVSASALRQNMINLKMIRSAYNRLKPDVVIYVDRMDLFRRELSDIPLLRLVNEMMPDILYSSVAILTRASAPPPETNQGEMSYNEYHRLRMDLCTQIISHAITDMRWGGRPMGFENHPSCRVNENVPVLPNGQAFKKQAIYQLISSRMYREIEKVCKTRQLRERTMRHMMFMMQPRKQLQLTALVSQLLTSKPPKKFPEEEKNIRSEGEIKRMPSRLRRAEEYRRRDFARMRKVEILQEAAHPSQVPIVGANMELNPSFDHEVNQHRYNATDFVNGWSIRPIISAPDNTYDHDDGIEMFQVARDGVLRKPGAVMGGFPSSMIVQAGKGKGASNITMETGLSYYRGRCVILTLGAVMHPAGQDGEVVYTPTADFRIKMFDRLKTTFGLMACRLAEDGWPHKGQLSMGAKFENKLKVTDKIKLMGSLGGMTMKMAQNQARDIAYGANMELKYAAGKEEYDSSFILSGGLTVQKRGSFKRTGLNGALAFEQAISPETMVCARINMTSGGSGTTTLRMITHDKPQWGWIMVFPLVIKAVKRLAGHGDDFA